MIPADKAVEELIHKYGRLVFHTIYGMTGDWEESQDLTQDTFHQALKSIDAARSVSGTQFHEKAWLMRIALNTVRMQRRRHGLFRFIPFSRMQKGNRTTEEAYDTATDTLNEQAAPVQPPGYGVTGGDDPADMIAERDAVQRTMAQLPETLRECLLLSIVGNFSSSEIARMLDLQEAAVRNVSLGLGNNFNNCMHWKMVNKLPTMVRLPQLPVSSSGRPASIKTTRDVSRAG